MRAVVALALKDLRIFSRSGSAMFFAFAWPIIIAVLFGMMFGGGGDRPSPRLRVAVADEDQSPQSQTFIEALAKSASLDVAPLSRDEAIETVRTGRRVAAIVVPGGFGAARDRLFVGTSPTVDVWVDPSRQAEAGLLEGVLMQEGAQALQELFSDPARAQWRVRGMIEQLQGAETQAAPGLGPFLGHLDTFLGESAAATPAEPVEGADAGSWQPLRVTQHALLRERTGPRSAYDWTFPQAMLWAVFGCVMTFSGSFVSERVRGTFMRLQVSPMTRRQILAGKAVAAFLTIVVVLSVLVALAVAVFGVRPTSWPGLLAAILSVGTAFVGVIVMLASLLKTEHAVGGVGPAVMMPMFLVGGGMIPLIAMPAWMISVSHVSPVKWAILAFEGAIWRGFSAAEMVMPCGILLGVGVVTLWIGSRVRN